VLKLIINGAMNLFFLTAVGISPISNHSSFRVPFDKIASVYFIRKEVFIFQNWKWPAHAGNQHCANCIGTLAFPVSPAGHADTAAVSINDV